MNDLRKLSEDPQIPPSNSSEKKTASTDPPRYSKFKSLKSLPNSFRLNKPSARMNTINEIDGIEEIPPLTTCPKRKSLCGDALKIKYEKAITALPLNKLSLAPNVMNAPQLTGSSRLSSNNEISYKERKLIRQGTLSTNLNNQNKDTEYQDTFNQTTQFKSFQSGYLPTESLEGYQLTIPPLQTNLDLLTESDRESDESLSRINERKREKRNNLIQLMKTNPYHSLKHNVYYTYRKNQLTYKKYACNKPIINGMKTKEEGALYKINKQSTLYLKNKPNMPNIILRLLARKHEMPSEFKNVIFWKGIQWLWKNYFAQIEKVLFSFHNYKWFLEKEKLITSKAVEEFCLLIQLEKYQDFCDALFLIFDEGSMKRIYLKFALTVLINTTRTPYQEQMKEMIEVWEAGRTGRIHCKEINEIIKNLFSNKKDIKAILSIIKSTFELSDWSTETVEKSDLLNLFLSDHKIPYLIRRNKVDIDQIDQVFKEEILNLFNINMRNSKMSLEAHDAQKFCANDINRYEQVLFTLAHHESEKEKRRVQRVSHQEGDISDD